VPSVSVFSLVAEWIRRRGKMSGTQILDSDPEGLYSSGDRS
jgi:hypothetical protein